MDLIANNGIKLGATNLSLTRRITLDEASKYIAQLDTFESGLAYWIGDLLNSLEALYGETYAQVIPDGKASTWMNYKWVSERVKPQMRRANLTWTHHQAVASLLHERQAIYLDRAETEGLSVSSLKALIKAEKGKAPKESVTRLITCPACGHDFEVENATTKGPRARDREILQGTAE